MMWSPFNTYQSYRQRRYQLSLSRLAYGSATLLTTVGMILTVDAIAPRRASAQLASAQLASAQLLAQSPAPTARYAQGENVDLADIVAEWRGYYADVPVYLCVCQEDTCNQTQQWPFKEYFQYEMSVALGPTNGQISETAGSKCFDIADGSRPSDPRDFVIAERADQAPAATTAPPVVTPPAPVTRPRDVNNADDFPTTSRPAVSPRPAQPVTQPAAIAAAQPVNSGDVPTAIAINQGADIQLTWPSGASTVVAVAGSNWNINILDAIDCDTFSQVAQKTYEATRIIGEPAVDAITGNVAVPVLLSTCADVDQSAIFILDPNEGGGYALYRSQFVGFGGAFPGETRNFPNEFSSYAFSTISDVRYWDGSLFVRHSDNSGTAAVVIFRRAASPAGTYAGCAIVTVGESNLCPQ